MQRDRADLFLKAVLSGFYSILTFSIMQTKRDVDLIKTA